ncbi:lipase 3-like [Bacillus rossius redtenbacheri]|uniref:lipase 3-like n=1 Tax=Bacillus rossius redtenbacheri TaxID=93214 RepID=UPI002FDDEA57
MSGAGLLVTTMFLASLLLSAGSLHRLNQEAYLTVPELVASRGYPSESHDVVTEDGYILTMHRIPHGRHGPSVDRPPVLVQHGILCSSACWVLSTSEKALGFVLADAGYDVWLGNFRGTNYAKKHVSLNLTDKQFWDFSWHELGVYDLPAMVDYVLSRTGREGLFYVAHSMGTTSFFVLLSMRPEYNSKILAQFSLAPVAFLSHVRSPVIRLIIPFLTSLHQLQMVGPGEFLPNSQFLSAVASLACPDGALTPPVCTDISFLLTGFNQRQFNMTLLPVITGHVPAGSSIHQFLHYAQEVHSGRFRQFDRGVVGNLLAYGSVEPPDYDLSKVTAPVYLYWGENDWLADAEDVRELESKLPCVRASTRVPHPCFNHQDFMWAVDVEALLYRDVLARMAALRPPR